MSDGASVTGFVSVKDVQGKLSVSRILSGLLYVLNASYGFRN